MTQLDTARDARIVPLQATARRRLRPKDSDGRPMGEVVLFTGVRYERLAQSPETGESAPDVAATGAAKPSLDH